MSKIIRVEKCILCPRYSLQCTDNLFISQGIPATCPLEDDIPFDIKEELAAVKSERDFLRDRVKKLENEIQRLNDYCEGVLV